MEFNFPQVQGTGLTKLIPHASFEVQDLITKLLIYNPDNRITASSTLKHPWFRDLREQEYMLNKQYGSLTQPSVRAPLDQQKDIDHFSGDNSPSWYGENSDDNGGGHGTENEVKSLNQHQMQGPIIKNKN